MNKLNILVAVLLLCMFGCKTTEEEHEGFAVFCEMVANGAKPVALSFPMEQDEADDLWEDYQEIADHYGVQLYREDNFPVTPLFPAAATDNKTVIIIYQGNRLTQYRQLKADITRKPVSTRSQSLGYARRLGRLLGYDQRGINALLEKNSGLKTLSSFRVSRQVTHLYYENLAEAIDFYNNTLGLQALDSAMFYIGKDAMIRLHSVDETHPAGQAKSTAIAFLTDQLPEWYQHIQNQNVPVRYTYKPKDGGPHDGFVAIDPGGYLLEFEQFKQHPENELFIAVLSTSNPVSTSVDKLEFYGAITWTYHNDLLKMQRYYEEVLGFQLVADQGWTKIYQTAGSAFIGLVDERRGMEGYHDEKAVEIEWTLEDLKTFIEYSDSKQEEWDIQGTTFIGPEKYRYRVSD